MFYKFFPYIVSLLLGQGLPGLESLCIKILAGNLGALRALLLTQGTQGSAQECARRSLKDLDLRGFDFRETSPVLVKALEFLNLKWLSLWRSLGLDSS